MPATINGTSGFGGNLTGNVTGNSDTATSATTATTATTATKLSTASGDAPVYGCRAWVNFDGTRNAADTGASTNGANVKIRASGNVSSVLKNAAGDYTINFTTAMPDVNYSISGTGRYADNQTANASSTRWISLSSVGTLANAMTTSSVRINSTYANAGYDDCQVVCVSVFR
jgi:hypothetical protein